MSMLDPTTLAALRAAKEKATIPPNLDQYYYRPDAPGPGVILDRSVIQTCIGNETQPNLIEFFGADSPYDEQIDALAEFTALLLNSAAALLDAAEENVRLRKALEWYATTNAPEVATAALKGTP